MGFPGTKQWERGECHRHSCANVIPSRRKCARPMPLMEELILRVLVIFPLPARASTLEATQGMMRA